MSKSKPEYNIDPLEMIKQFGADALRLSMVVGTTPGNDLALYKGKISGYRNFVNKLWNISRFIISNVDKPKIIEDRPKVQTLADQWILSELDKMIDFATKNLENYKLAIVGEKLYEFTWAKLADIYLEIAKVEKNVVTPAKAGVHSTRDKLSIIVDSRFRGNDRIVSEDDGNKDKILLYILTQLLKLWHPFIPFVTEHIWTDLLGAKQMLMITPWPKSEKSKPVKFEKIEEIITAIRNKQGKRKVEPKKKDVSKEIKELENYIAGLKKRIGNKEFISKAPKEIVAKEKAKLIEAKNKLNKLI
jgi:valyl-tRNA synthetase